MRKYVAVLSVLLIACFVPSAAFGASPWTEKTTYKEKVVGKLEFGVKNFLGGWTELISRPTKADNFVVGIGQGIANAVVFTLGGLLHTVTFYAPQIDVPLPENGVNLD